LLKVITRQLRSWCDLWVTRPPNTSARNVS